MVETTTQYVYDSLDQLTKETRLNGMRKTMTTGSKTITFHYDEDDNVTHETDGNNQVVASYIYADNQPISMTRGGKPTTTKPTTGEMWSHSPIQLELW